MHEYGAMFLIPALLMVDIKVTGKGINDSRLNGFRFTMIDAVSNSTK
jgi:hypothetical protein